MRSTTLRHDAFVYGADEQFASLMAPFLQAGLAAGEAAVAVTTRRNLDLLREVLGPQAGDVTLLDRDEWYVHPANVIAAYDGTLRRHLKAGAPGVRIIGEVRFGDSPEEWDEWTGYEAILNRAFARRPAWITCPYDARALPDRVLEGASHTHPHLISDERSESTGFIDPDELVRTLAPEPRPLEGLRTVAVGDRARDFRDALTLEMAADGVSPEAACDLLAAAGEAFINVHRHACGAPAVRVGPVDGLFVCEISDSGPGLDDPLAGYTPPSAGDTAGAGLWVARQLTRRLELLSSPSGLTVRLWR
jgi:hypothetical protein